MRQHRPGGSKHDAGQRRGDDSRKYRIENKICDEPGEIPVGQCAGGKEQNDRNQEDKGALRKGQIDRLRHPAHLVLIVSGLAAVILNGFFERLEGIDRLLEDFHHRDAADILGARLGHTVLGRLIFCHQLGVFSAHHGEHGDDGNHRRQQAGSAHPPVEDEHQHQHRKEHDDCADDVCQIVCQQRFGVGRRRVQPSPDKAGGVGVKIA